MTETEGKQVFTRNGAYSATERLYLKYFAAFFTGLVTYTDDQGAVDEDRFRDHVRQLIGKYKNLRKAYTLYRQLMWDKHQVSRLVGGGQFDNFGYLPSHSPLVAAILAEN